MSIPTWCIVVFSIVILITILLILKINIVLVYKNGFSVYLKILFFKIRLFPEKKKEKKFFKKSTKKKKASSSRKEEASKKDKKKLEPIKIVRIINAMKDTISDFVSSFFGRLHFEFVKIHAEIGCEDAAKTAIAYGTVTQSVAYTIEFLNNISNVEMTRASDIDIRANFISQKSWITLNCVLYLRVISILSLGVKAIKAFFKFKIIKDKLSEVDTDGTIEAK